MTDAAEPDDVTLWAGRLRSWPAPPPVDADEVETVPSRRAATVEEGPPSESVDDTVRSRSAEGTAALPRSDADGAGLRRSAASPFSDGERARDAPATEAAAADAPTADVAALGALTADATAVLERRGRGEPRAHVPGEERRALRDAYSPPPRGLETYALRGDVPVRLARTRSVPEAAIGDAAPPTPHRARGGVRVALLVTAVVAVMALAVVGLALLVG